MPRSLPSLALASLLLLPGGRAAAAAALRTERPELPPHTTITGRLLAHDGTPLRAGHVQLAGRGVAVERDGRFALQVPGSGLERLSFSGVGHQASSARIALDGRPVQLEVRLGTHARPALPESVTLVWRGPGSGAPAEQAMRRTTDGTFEAVLDTAPGRLTYQLRGVASRPMGDPQAQAFEEDGAWDYRSVLQAPGGKLRVVFDPRGLPPAGLPPRLTFAEPSRARLHAIASAVDARRSAASEAGMAAAKRGGDFEAARRAFIARQPWRTQLLAERQRERDPALRSALLIATLALVAPEHATQAERRLARAAVASVPAHSPLWGLDPAAARNVAALLGRTRRAQAILDALAQSSADPTTHGASAPCAPSCSSVEPPGIGPMSSGREAAP